MDLGKSGNRRKVRPGWPALATTASATATAATVAAICQMSMREKRSGFFTISCSLQISSSICRPVIMLLLLLVLLLLVLRLPVLLLLVLRLLLLLLLLPVLLLLLLLLLLLALLLQLISKQCAHWCDPNSTSNKDHHLSSYSLRNKAVPVRTFNSDLRNTGQTSPSPGQSCALAVNTNGSGFVLLLLCFAAALSCCAGGDGVLLVELLLLLLLHLARGRCPLSNRF